MSLRKNAVRPYPIFPVPTALAMEEIPASGVLGSADAALYQAKHEGRNRVIAVDFYVAKIS